MEGIWKRRSRGLLLKDRVGRGGKREGRGREEKDKKGRGAACPNNKMPTVKAKHVKVILLCCKITMHLPETALD